MGMFEDLKQSDQLTKSLFEDLKSKPSVFDSIQQDRADSNFIKAAQDSVKLVMKLNKEGAGQALKFYSKIHSAVKSAAANVVNTALDNEQLDVTGSLQQGFASGNTPASTVVSPVTTALSDTLPSISAPAGLNELVQYGTTPGLIGKGYTKLAESVRPLVGKGIPDKELKLIPDIPEEITPSEYLKFPSQIAEVAVDVLTDPVLAALGPVVKGAKALSKLTGLTDILKDTIKSTAKSLDPKIVDIFIKPFTTTYGRNPELVKLLDDFHTADRKASSLADGMSQLLTEGMTKLDRSSIGEAIRSGSLKALPKDLAGKAKVAIDAMKALGVESVKEGFMTSKTFMKHTKNYFPVLYKDIEVSKLVKKYGIQSSEAPKLIGSRFKQRAKMTPAQRVQLGMVTDPAYPVSKYIMQVSHDLNIHQLLKAVKGNENWTTNLAKEGYEYLESSKSGKVLWGKNWGVLGNTWVRKDIVDELKTITHVYSGFEKVYSKALNMYKMGKVIPNPTTWFNNIFGNIVMSDLSNSANLVTMPMKLYKAADEMYQKGKFMQEIIHAGAWNTDYWSTERNLLRDVVGTLKSSPTIADILHTGPMNYLKSLSTQGIDFAKSGFDKLTKFYSGQDNLFKVLHYMHARNNLKMEVPQAIQYMQKWGFDFSKVAPATAWARQYTSPFITYSAKALPRVGEVILNNPAKFYKYPVLFDAINRMSARVHGLDEVDLQNVINNNNGQQLLLPWVDSESNPLTMNLSYTLPWGDMAQHGGTFGLPASISLSNPMFTVPIQLIANKNLYTNQPITTDLNQNGVPRFLNGGSIKEYLKFVYQTLMPSMIPGGYTADSVNKALSTVYEHRHTPTGLPYDAKLTLLQAFAGAKIRGVDVNRVLSFKGKKLEKWVNDRQIRINKIERNQSLTPQEKDKSIQKEISILENEILKEGNKL